LYHIVLISISVKVWIGMTNVCQSFRRAPLCLC